MTWRVGNHSSVLTTGVPLVVFSVFIVAYCVFMLYDHEASIANRIIKMDKANRQIGLRYAETLYATHKCALGQAYLRDELLQLTWEEHAKKIHYVDSTM